MAAAAKAVNAHAAVASSAYIALGYCEVKVAIARGPVYPKIASEAILEGLKFKNFLVGMPQTPLACTLCTRVCIPPPDQCE